MYIAQLKTAIVDQDAVHISNYISNIKYIYQIPSTFNSMYNRNYNTEQTRPQHKSVTIKPKKKDLLSCSVEAVLIKPGTHNLLLH